MLDLGAEFIHGKGTLLTDLVEQYAEKWSKRIGDSSRLLEEIFVTAHADGGPSEGPTEDGYYGLYYMHNELMEGDDPRLKPLHDVLHSLDKEPCDNCTSIGDVLDRRIDCDELQSMAVAGYANTVGCTDMHNVSLSALNAFEKHWEDNEIEGDLRIHSLVGMQGVIDALVEELQARDGFCAKLKWKVTSIQENDGIVKVTSDSGQVLEADAVIVTVPPPIMSELGLELPIKKLEALKYIGFEKAIKFVLKFSQRMWPTHLQSLICANSTIPEMWFRDFVDTDDDEEKKCVGSSHIAVCYLTSDSAQDFLHMIANERAEPCLKKGADIVIRQLSDMLDVPISDLAGAHVDSLMYDWSDHPTISGGYMYPKVGMTLDHLRDLAASHGRIFFAGEATNTNACCTIQAAMETGVRAAEEVHEHMHGQR